MYSKEYFQNIKNEQLDTAIPDELTIIMGKIDKILFKDQVNDWRNKPKPNFLKKQTDNETETFKQEINGMLNKLSHNNFDSLSAKIIELMGKCELWDYFIEALFNKSIIQPIFCPIYVKLLKSANSDIIIEFLETKIKEYLTILNGVAPIKENKENKEDFNYDDFCKNNKLKLIKGAYSQFIGELYINDLCKYKYVIDNSIFFITNIETVDNNDLEDNIICLDKLIRTIKKNMNIHDKTLVKTKLEACIKNRKAFPIRLKFKLMGIIDVL